MFLYLRNKKYVSNFIYWLFLFDGNYSNNKLFLLRSFSTNCEVSKQDTLFARNWKCCLKVEKKPKNILLYLKTDVAGMDIMFIKWNIDFGFRKLIKICEVLWREFCLWKLTLNLVHFIKKTRTAHFWIHLLLATLPYYYFIPGTVLRFPPCTEIFTIPVFC